MCVAVNTSACESGKDGGGRCPPQAPAIPSAILRKPQSGNSATRGTVAFPRSAPRARGAPGWSRCAISDPVPLETLDADACFRPRSWLSSSTGFALARNQCQSRCPAYLGPNRQWSLCRLWFCLWIWAPDSTRLRVLGSLSLRQHWPLAASGNCSERVQP